MIPILEAFMSDSLDNFIHDALQELDGVEPPTVITADPQLAVGGMGVLPGHAVEGFIARGGMGAVYRARQQALEREVAVKVMTRLVDTPEMTARFRREALVLGMLAHPNIVPVYDIGTDDEGHLYYTMKLVKGRTLQAILHDLLRYESEVLREYTLDRLLLIFQKVCDAVAFAHSKGVLHRDLKPENVMVGEFGEVLVMDWGLARRLERETGRQGDGETSASDVSLPLSLPDTLSLQTLQGSVMGTPQYMSPEQAMGQIDELDERSDIFSLGGILYAILTLRPPVEGKTLEEVLSKVMSAEITAPTALQGAASKAKTTKKADVLDAQLIKTLPHTPSGRVPAALSSVVMKALRLEKVRRYQSVADLGTDIESYQGGFATSAEQAGALKQLKLLMLRHKMVTGALAAMLVISTLFVIKVMASERTARASEAVAIQREAETRRALARSAISLAEAALREGDGPATRRALDEVPEDLRDPTWRYLVQQSDSSIAQLGMIYGAFPHPQQPGVFAVVHWVEGFRLLDVRTQKTLRKFDSAPASKAWGYNQCIAMSPDAERIAVVRRSKDAAWIEVYQVGSGALISQMKTGITEKVAFSPDGRRLVRRSTFIKARI